MANRRIEDEISEISRLREGPAEGAEPMLRLAMTNRTNLVAAKAAEVAAAQRLPELVPDLLAAYDRFFEDPVKRDPQCWAKNAIARALRDLDYAISTPFLRGSGYVQMEPVWGGQQDTAATLRGICLLALPGCSDIRREDVMRRLVDGLTDPDPKVRADSAHALGAMGGDDSALVLRLKARVGDEDPAVTGQAIESLLAVERAHALPFVRTFLVPEGGVAAEEAALALGTSRMTSAVDLLLEAWEAAAAHDYRDAVLRGLSLSRDDRAVAFLEKLAAEGREYEQIAARAALQLFPDSAATNG
jgi:hypothetical protein